MTGLADVELEVPPAGRDGRSPTSFPITWSRTPSSSPRDWVGLTLPGMIELPGSFSGMVELAQPACGPGRQPAQVVGDLHQRRGQRLEGPRAKTSASCAGERLDLLGRSRTAGPVSSAIRWATAPANSGWAFSPVPTAVPPSASS